MNKNYIPTTSFFFILIATLFLFAITHFEIKYFPYKLFVEIDLAVILTAASVWFYFYDPLRKKDKAFKKNLINRNYNLKQLNAELEKTKSILEATNIDAKVGGWELNVITNELTWTKVTKLIHELPEDYQPELTTAINYYKEGLHRETIQNSLNNLIKTGESYKIDAILLTANGNEKWIRAYGNAVMKDGVCVRLYGTIQDIHEKKVQSIQLKDNEQKYRSLFENNNVPFILFDENGFVINANEAAVTLFGYSSEEFNLLEAHKLFVDLYEKKEELIQRRKKYGYGIMELKGFKKDTSFFDCEVYSSSFVNSQGNNNVIKIIKDTTALNEANKKIRKNEETFAKLLEKAEIGIYEFQLDSLGDMKLNFVSKGFEKIFNDLTMDQMLNNFSLVLQKTHPEEIESILESIQESSKNLTDWNVIYRIIHQGETRWIKGSSKPERKSNGTTIWYGYIQDITNMINLENKIKDNENVLLNLTQKIEVCIFEFISNPNGLIYFNFISKAFETIFPDLSIEEMKKNASLLIYKVHPEDQEKVMKSVINSIKKKTYWVDEYRVISNDKIIWLKGEATPEVKADGTIYWYGFLEDITNKKEEYMRLKLLESVVTHTKDMIMITEAEPIDGPNGPKILYVNNAFEKITGYTKDEVLNDTPRILQGVDTNKVKLHKMKEAMKKWETHTTEVLNYKKNGEPFWNNFTIIPIADEKGWFTHWISIERDVTEQRKIILQLEERNEKLEQIAFEQSHVVRAPLARIMGLIDYLQKNPIENNEEIVKYISNSANELDTIIRDIVKSINHQTKD